MSERDGYEPGVPCWIDHSSADPGAAAEFYSGLFGWETEDLMPPDAPGRYIGCRLRGHDVAAIGSQQSEDSPPLWNTYVWAESADDTIAKVKAAGGTVTGEPFDVFDAGRMAVFQDPSGAWLSLWQAGRHRGAALVNEPGTWCWAELAAGDTEAAKGFYGEVFGWQGQAMDAEGDDYTLWYLDGEIGPETRPVAGMAQLDPNAPGSRPPSWGIAFSVDGTDAICSRAEELGGTVVMAPFDTSVGRTAVATDPLGAGFAVITLEGV